MHKTSIKKPIKKQKLIIFVTQLKKYKIKVDEKGEITTMMRDLGGIILALSLQKKLTW